MSFVQSNTKFLTSLEDENITVLTPNRRLASVLLNQFNEFQVTQNKLYWKPLDILPLSSWLQRIFKSLTSHSINSCPLLLSNAQELLLWEELLRNQQDKLQLLQVSQTAELAKTAYGLLKQWEINVQDEFFHQAEDYLIFKTWVAEFEKHCAQKNWLSLSSLPDFIKQHITPTNQNLFPDQFRLIGFTELSPQLLSLFSLLEKIDCSNTKIAFPQQNALSYQVNRADPVDEFFSMAQWAKEKLEVHPLAKIACVIPSLEIYRDRIIQIFNEVFFDEKFSQPQFEFFNLSAGKPLLQYPIVSICFKLLKLCKNEVDSGMLTDILLSPFLGESLTELNARSYLDLSLRKKNLHSLSLDLLFTSSELKQLFQTITPKLYERFTNFWNIFKAYSHKASHSFWSVRIHELLTTLGWPGERSANSEEYQVIESWLHLLNDLNSLEMISKPISLSRAIGDLNLLASKHIFQPQSPAAPIQILGVLEAASLPFDFLWVSGCDDATWPPLPKPHPLIPKALQRKLNMPHASALRELHYCKELLTQFQHSAKEAIFSFAEKKDEMELQASPLISQFPVIKESDLLQKKYTRLSDRVFNIKAVELLEDNQAPALLTQETIRGSISLLQQQALCPFRAFAQWRLQADTLEIPSLGLKGKDRGNIVHKVMELIWNNLGDQSHLATLSQEALDNKIDTSIEQSLKNYTHGKAHYSEYLHLEKIRLKKIINDWLLQEKNRSSFKVIAREKQISIPFEQLSFSLRIDRIDELEDGSLLIIDYKTSKQNSIGHWFGERPEEPQLPLYSLFDADKIAGISFAQVFPGEHVFKGVSKYELNIQGINPIKNIKNAQPNWFEQLNSWRSILSKLTQDFCQGSAHVDPKDHPNTCNWCELKPLCRIYEALETV